MIVGGVFVLAIIGFIIYRLVAPSLTGAIASLQTFPDVEAGHAEGALTYAQTPPVGGVHNPAWQNCGIYAEPIGSENAVHSMEHGAVWITYRPDLAVAEVEKLRVLVRGRRYTLLSPFADGPAPIVASAWGSQVQVDSSDDFRLEQFLSQFEQGPQTPEPGASCSGAVGLPVER